MGTVAKVMVNTSWELGSMPVVPAMDLVATHASRLAGLGVRDVMMTWSVGGYPSLNFAVFERLLSSGPVPEEELDQRLEAFAEEFYGRRSGPLVRAAWKSFSDGFSEYPYHVGTLYRGPQQVGPANLFYSVPTGWESTMVGFPYDDLKAWRSIYPAPFYIGQNQKVADAFEKGAKLLEDALARETDPDVKRLLALDSRRAQRIRCYFRSIVNQASFILSRDASDTEGMRRAILDELDNVKDFIPLCDADPTFGYESSNHYYYVRNDLLEKIINLNWILKNMS